MRKEKILDDSNAQECKKVFFDRLVMNLAEQLIEYADGQLSAWSLFWEENTKINGDCIF